MFDCSWKSEDGPPNYGPVERGTLSVKIEMSCVAKMVNGCVLAQADYAHMS